MKQTDIALAKLRKEEVIPLGQGKYLVLSSDGSKYYEVQCHNNKGNKLPLCQCPARRFAKLDCRHLKKVANYVELHWPQQKNLNTRTSKK